MRLHLFKQNIASNIHIEASIAAAIDRSTAFVASQSTLVDYYEQAKAAQPMASHSIWLAASVSAALNQLCALKPDWLLLLNGHVLEKAVSGFFSTLRNQGIRVIAWQIDDPYYIDESIKFADQVDLLLTVDASSLVRYAALNKHVHFLPLACDRRLVHRNASQAMRYDLSFIGTPFKGSRRVATIDALTETLSAKCSLVAGGTSLDRWSDNLREPSRLREVLHEGWFDHDKAIEVFATSRINLNIHKDSYGHAWDRNHARLKARSPCERTFVIAGAGGFQLIDSSRPDLATLFEIGHEVATFDTVEDLQNQISHFLSHPEQAARMAAASRQRALAQHTYDHRMSALQGLMQDMTPRSASVSAASAAIYFQPEAYTTSGPRLMGRNAAGESFLRGYLRYSRAAQFTVWVDQPGHAESFRLAMQAHQRQEPLTVVHRQNVGLLKKAGVVYYPGPGLGEHANQRTLFGDEAWSLCGITHTTSSARAMDAIASLVTSPVQAWDALICTSHAVKANVERILQAEIDRLSQRFGITRFVLPQLPVIPLGIHTQDFQFTAEQRQAARRRLSVDDETLVVLFMGRLSFHAKAHPLAMYQALERAALRTGRAVVLVECGWHANDFIRDAYQDAAKVACPQVRVVTLDGRDAMQRETAWAGADVFCSLSDNIQETFGIAPIEAMAAGLPVVVSDWDGYKDTVRQEIDGFRIPTLMPSAGFGNDLALRHALEIDNYDMYCGYTCSLIAVDVEAAAQAFERLFVSPELRRQMGAAGRARATAVYDWSVIMPRYEALWGQLDALRHDDGQRAARLKYPWPARMEPFAAFASYPSDVITQTTLIRRVDRDCEHALERLKTWHALAMVRFAAPVLPSLDEMCQLLTLASIEFQSVTQLLSGVPAGRRELMFRSLTHLLKLGLLSVAPTVNRQGVTA